MKTVQRQSTQFQTISDSIDTFFDSMNKKCDASLQYCADYAIRIRQVDEDLAASGKRIQRMAESNKELETSIKTLVAEAQDFGN